MTNRSNTPDLDFGINLVAMTTPMHPDGRISRPGVDASVEHLRALGCDGIVVAGTTGEAPTLTPRETIDVIEQVSNRGLRVIAGIGTSDTAAGVDLAASAATAGADALLVSAPPYSRTTQQGIAAHIVDIAEAAELPVMVYDVPARTGVEIEKATLFELAGHPLIGAVKDAKGDLYEAMTIMATTDLAYYCGIDELALAYLACGATGLVSVIGNVAADRNADLIDAIRAGDMDRAITVQRSVLPLIEAVMRTTQGAVAAKAALVRIGVLACAAVRRPLLESSSADLARLNQALEVSGIEQKSTSVRVQVRLP